MDIPVLGRTSPGVGRHEPQGVITANESCLGSNSIEMSAGCPPYSNHLLDEALLKEHYSYKLNTSQPWIVICDASTENPVNLRICMGPLHWRRHTLKLAGLVLRGRLAGADV